MADPLSAAILSASIASACTSGAIGIANIALREKGGILGWWWRNMYNEGRFSYMFEENNKTDVIAMLYRLSKYNKGELILKASYHRRIKITEREKFILRDSFPEIVNIDEIIIPDESFDVKLYANGRAKWSNRFGCRFYPKISGGKLVGFEIWTIRWFWNWFSPSKQECLQRINSYISELTFIKYGKINKFEVEQCSKGKGTAENYFVQYIKEIMTKEYKDREKDYKAQENDRNEFGVEETKSENPLVLKPTPTQASTVKKTIPVSTSRLLTEADVFSDDSKCEEKETEFAPMKDDKTTLLSKVAGIQLKKIINKSREQKKNE